MFERLSASVSQMSMKIGSLNLTFTESESIDVDECWKGVKSRF